MLEEISKYLRKNISNFPQEDKIIFNNQLIEINKNNFQPIEERREVKRIAFVDGGQAEIISAGNFCLSFMRIFGQVFLGEKRAESYKKEFYLLTTAKYLENDLWYESKIFGDKLIEEKDLLISSNDSSIRTGLERAPISRISSMARRLAELSLAAEIKADFIVLDGTLEPTFSKEEKYLAKLNENTSALAKSCSLFTVSGNSPIILLNKIGLEGCWGYFLEGKTHLVKLNDKAKHVFRFEGNPKILPYLIQNSKDALFLGYPYGLIFADKMARVSNEEKKSLQINFLFRKENKEIVEYLTTSNAHEILDRMG
ncbi:MAG TPA: DNA double-strand break repair nuclease NurA [Candidatus Nanoarchaeia archaeon]|nr:DNA double-strand break repair nuclease NurA [Candidatus Nanoarchaeia archaeon]